MVEPILHTGRISPLLAVFLVARIVTAQDSPPSGYNERPAHSAKAAAVFETNRAKYGASEHVLVLPGLVADRETKQIEVLAEATGIKPGVIVEFLLIDAASSKGYEALLWSHARPSDIHRALEFIGMRPGEPFRPGKLRFWPKGERVLTNVRAAGDDDRIPLESLVVDQTTKQTLPATGFVFTGSITVHKPDMPDEKAYAADVIDPRSVASIYNDSTAVLDVPRRALQHLVYGQQLVAPTCRFKKNELLTVTLEPEYKDGRRRVVDVSLDVTPADKQAATRSVEFELTDTRGRALTDRRKLADVLGVFGEMKRDGHDPFVSVQFSAGLKLGTVRDVCRLLQAIDTERGIRIEPPAKDQLYYEAFLPDPGLLDRERRIVDPWEVHLTADADDSVSAKLTRHQSRFVDGERVVSVETHDVPSAKALREYLDAEDARRKSLEQRPGPRVLLVFAHPEVSYGLLVKFLAPAMTTHNVVHVFPKRESGE